MYPSSRLKLNSVAFAVIWTVGMRCWEQPLDVAKLIVTSLCGLAFGYLWYRVMRSILPRGRVPAPRLASHADGAVSSSPSCGS
jgi:hypothetical protein